MPLREITLDDIEALAVGAWVLGTGGGGSPYLGLLNMRALYKEGHRVQLMPSSDLADDDWVAAVSNMGASSSPECTPQGIASGVRATSAATCSGRVATFIKPAPQRSAASAANAAAPAMP